MKVKESAQKEMNTYRYFYNDHTDLLRSNLPVCIGLKKYIKTFIYVIELEKKFIARTVRMLLFWIQNQKN